MFSIWLRGDSSIVNTSASMFFLAAATSSSVTWNSRHEKVHVHVQIVHVHIYLGAPEGRRDSRHDLAGRGGLADDHGSQEAGVTVHLKGVVLVSSTCLSCPSCLLILNFCSILYLTDGRHSSVPAGSRRGLGELTLGTQLLQVTAQQADESETCYNRSHDRPEPLTTIYLLSSSPVLLRTSHELPFPGPSGGNMCRCIVVKVYLYLFRYVQYTVDFIVSLTV